MIEYTDHPDNGDLMGKRIEAGVIAAGGGYQGLFKQGPEKPPTAEKPRKAEKPTAEKKPALSGGFVLGDWVEARYGGGKEWFPGVVQKVVDNGYCIDYDDGDHEDGVLPNYIRRYSMAVVQAPKASKAPGEAKKEKPRTPAQTKVQKPPKKPKGAEKQEGAAMEQLAATRAEEELPDEEPEEEDDADDGTGDDASVIFSSRKSPDDAVATAGKEREHDVQGDEDDRPAQKQKLPLPLPARQFIRSRPASRRGGHHGSNCESRAEFHRRTHQQNQWFSDDDDDRACT
jgi:hypothetical protein